MRLSKILFQIINDIQSIAFSYIVGEENEIRFLGLANRNFIIELNICY
jgi:hypothetical protein